MEKIEKTEKEIQMENINSDYLTDEQLRLYLEACLDHKVTDFEVEPDPSLEKFNYTNPEEFRRLINSKKFSEQDNIFYRVWVYQYEGLKDLLSPDSPLLNRENTNYFAKNLEDTKNAKNSDKGKKNLSFRFTFGSIDIKDLQKENLFYKQLKENPNINFDEYKPKDSEIAEQKKKLNIIFLYVNLGVPLLEDDIELDDNSKISSSQHKYKYEFDIDKVVYYRKITFSLYESETNLKCFFCHSTLASNNFWILEERMNGNDIRVACSKCLPKTKENDDRKEYKLIDNTKYSIRYFWYCDEPGHNTKKYEYYCLDCKRPFCVKCLISQHSELNEKHNLIDIPSRDSNNVNNTININNNEIQEKDNNNSINNDKQDVDNKIFYKDKIKEINKQKIKNDKIWEEINDAGDKAELSLRERESKAIVEVKNEVLARCTFLTSMGYELQRMIGELDFKTKFIQDLKKDSNVSTYLNMNNMFLEDLKNHYIPNLEKIEALPLDKFLETFHKIDKKYPDDNKIKDIEDDDEDEEKEDDEFSDNEQ